MFTLKRYLTEGRRLHFAYPLLLGLMLIVHNVAFGQQSKIPLTTAIEEIEQRFQANLSYEHNLLEGKSTTTEALRGEKLEEVLKNVLYPNQFIFLYVDERSYTIVPRKEQTVRSEVSSPQTQVAYAPNLIDRVEGTVRSGSGKQIPFATVWVKGTRKGTKSDENGRFLLYDVSINDSVAVSAVGYGNVLVPIAGRKQLPITLQEIENALEEVVISTGYQKLSKERSTGSASVVTAKDLEKIPTPNVIQRLEGLVPGLQVNILAGDRTFTYNNNQLSLSSSTTTVGQTEYGLTIRGRSSIDSDTEKNPLVVIDGAISSFDLSTLNPNDVESITFLKDAAAASIYGVRAANGVIVVNTKRGNTTGVPRISFSANMAFSGNPDLSYLRMMNSAQMIDYQEELVEKGFLNTNNISSSDYSYAPYYAGTVAAAAIKLKNNLITQAEYDAHVDPLRSIDNRSQIQQYLLQPMSSQQYNLSISNGTENNSYYYSASYSNENPHSKGDNGKRLTLNLNNSWKLFNIATLSTSIKGSFFRQQNNGLGLSAIFDPGSSTLLPYQLLADENGNGIAYDRLTPEYTNNLGSAYKDWRYNYLQELAVADNVQKDNNYMATINLEVPIFKGLKGSVMYANERSFSNTRRYYDEDSYYYRDFINRFTPIGATTNSLGISSGGIYSLTNTTVNNYTLRGQLSYNAMLGRQHDLTVIAGSEIRQTEMGQGGVTLYGYNMETGYNTAVDYTSPGYESILGYAQAISGAPSQGDRKRRFLSYFSNAAYTYAGKYTLSGSVRYDDYNNFGLDRSYRATPLWSSGLKWNIYKEDFMQQYTWLNRLGLRATYGVNGNISQDTRPFTYITLNSTSLNVTGRPSASIIALANPQLRWEKTYVTNLGLDFAVLNSRLSGSVDYYYKDGRDLLYSFPISAAYTGTVNNGTLKRNAASMEGKGVDLGLTGVLLRNKDWYFDMTANFSYNTNKVTDNRFDQADITTSYLSYFPSNIGYLAGYPTDKLFVFRHAGLNEEGLTQVYDRNGNVVQASETLSELEDLKYAGRTTAPYFGSLRANLRYKQWSFYALVTYQFGNVFLKPSIQSYMTSSRYGVNSPIYDLSADIADRWREAGDEAFTNVPAISTSTYGQYSLYRYQYADINVLKGDYIRLREISLSYSLPKGWLNKWKVEGLSLSGSVRNLGLLWTANKEGYDPDYTNYVGNTTNLRPVPSYNFSLNVNF